MIVITGATGHIGNNVVRMMMERDIPFKVLLRRDGKELEGLEIEKHIGNLYSSDFYNEHITSCDTVIHLAGFIDLGNKDYNQSYEANYVMTKIIADVCLNKGARLIFASSTDILVHHENGYRIMDPEKIKYNYQKTKTMATLYIKELKKKGLDALILYPTSVIGINDYKGSQAGKEIIKGHKRKFLPYIKGGYDFIDVLDVSDAIINSVFLDVSDDIILSGNYYKIKDLYKLIGTLTNKKKILVYIPSILAKMGAFFIKDYSPMMVEIVANSKPFNDPKTKLILKERTPISETFKNVLKEAKRKKGE